MKKVVALVTILLLGTVLANEYCASQKILGFEDATFMRGADVSANNLQEVIDSLLGQLGKNLTQVDAFATPRTHYALFRATATNELVLMTSSKSHVCFYWVPTKEPIRFSHEVS